MKRKLGLIILDGLGLGKEDKCNAFYLANTPNIDRLLSSCRHSKLLTSGLAVGLPQGQFGNSEIGHLNIGGGRTVKSELVRINEDISHNQFVYNPNFQKVLSLAKRRGCKIHVIGLTSYGGVHSHLTHLIRILNHCGEQGIKTVAHVIGDGRDCAIGSINYDVREIQNIDDYFGEVVKIGTVSGRYYAMDRDKNFDRTRKTIDAMMQVGPSYTNLEDYLAHNFGVERKTDEFLIPAFDAKSPDNKLEKGDIVFFFNFRQDRARQFCHMIKKSKLYSETSPAWDLDLTLVTMVQYDGIDADIVIYPPQQMPNNLGKVIADNGLKQLRIAETEKYAHVTFFLDGGKEYDYPNETKLLIPSPKVETYDLKPEMSAYVITDKLLENMPNFDVVICNYANCDMVGHTGNMKAAIKAVEVVDECVGKIAAKAREIGMTLFITSDHGNCDCMIDSSGQKVTCHTSAPVFFISTDNSVRLHDGTLGNIAPTVLKYLDLDIPREMDKKPLY